MWVIYQEYEPTNTLKIQHRQKTRQHVTVHLGDAHTVTVFVSCREQIRCIIHTELFNVEGD